jgi:hypothetical protein
MLPLRVMFRGLKKFEVMMKLVKTHMTCPSGYHGVSFFLSRFIIGDKEGNKKKNDQSKSINHRNIMHQILV